MSKKGTKTIETKLGSNYIPQLTPTSTYVSTRIDNEKKSMDSFTKQRITNDPITSRMELSKKPVAPVPEAKLSPLRSRFQERSAGKIPIQEQAHPLTQKGRERDETKPRKKIVVDVKSPPKVFKSPTWYKSPSRKVVTEENVCLKQLLLKDPRYTEQDIEKILNDHK